MQPVREAAAFHHAAGKLVDDDDLVGLDDVILVLLEELVGAQGVVHMVNNRDVLDVIEVALCENAMLAQHFFDALIAVFGQVDGALLLIKLVIFFADMRNDFINGEIKVRLVVQWAGDDERRARLVDQD